MLINEACASKGGHIIEKTYQTSEVATMIGIHSNTVRMYEEWGLISKARRAENGYRVFTDLHIDQLKLARTAFQIEVLQGDLCKTIICAVKQSALLHTDHLLKNPSKTALFARIFSMSITL